MAAEAHRDGTKLLLGATLLVPLAATLRFLVGAPAIAIFVVGGLAIVVLAEWMRRATEQVAIHAGPTIGGLLNVSFGSAAELILALFVVVGGYASPPRALPATLTASSTS